MRGRVRARARAMMKIRATVTFCSSKILVPVVGFTILCNRGTEINVPGFAANTFLPRDSHGSKCEYSGH